MSPLTLILHRPRHFLISVLLLSPSARFIYGFSSSRSTVSVSSVAFPRFFMEAPTLLLGDRSCNIGSIRKELASGPVCGCCERDRNTDNNNSGTPLEKEDTAGSPERKRQSNAERNHKPTPTKPPKKTRKYRPGFNSYLKVVLDNSTIQGLHKCAVQIQKELHEGEQGRDQQTEGGIESSLTSASLLRLKPRSLKSLHMTLLFAGETLCELPATELVEWHSRVATRLAKSRFHHESFEKGVDADKVKVQNEADDMPDLSFQVQGFKIFPPQRQNLVVAILEPTDSAAWQNLYEGLSSISKDETCSKALAETVKSTSKGKKWVAHVTLGNLSTVGGGRGDSGRQGGSGRQWRKQLQDPNQKLLNPILDLVFQSQNAANAEEVGWLAYPKAIAMGGPIPKQVELDWHFVYQSFSVHR